MNCNPITILPIQRHTLYFTFIFWRTIDIALINFSKGLLEQQPTTLSLSECWMREDLRYIEILPTPESQNRPTIGVIRVLAPS